MPSFETTPGAADGTMSLRSLPLFPLGLVLFPGGLLPLRIFEVRYLDMIGKCVKAGAPFGVVTLIKGSDVRTPEGQETFSGVGTLATITQCERPQPGLMVIQCTGGRRFRIRASNQLRHGLWVADVDLLAEDQTVPVPSDLQNAAQALSQLIASLQGRGLGLEEMPLAAPYRLQECSWLANRWCELLPLPLELKQRLMELDNPLLRLELVNDLLDRHGLLGPRAL
jgi:Lon protease-like protein